MDGVNVFPNAFIHDATFSSPVLADRELMDLPVNAMLCAQLGALVNHV